MTEHEPAKPGRGGTPATDPTVVVVGGGIAGLAAAWELTGGAAGPGPETPRVVVLESDARLGGKLRTDPVGGRPVDVGPDGFLGRRREAAALCRELGLGAALEPIGASGAAVWARGRRRPLPAGLFLGVPTRFLPVARSGILSPRGTVRLLVDLVLPRPDRRGPLGDRAVGPLVTRKLGRQVAQRLVDPLLGGIYAGGITDASAAAVFPSLLHISQGRASFMRAMGRMAATAPTTPGPAPAPVEQTAASADLRPPGGPVPSPAEPGPAAASAAASGPAPAPTEPGPAFWALRGGFATLVDRLEAALAERGVEIRTSCPATRLAHGSDGWTVETAGGPVTAQGVVLAVPAPPAAALLSPVDADAASLLQTVTYASVAVVTLAYPAGALPDDLVGTGLLVPRETPLPPDSATLLGAAPGDRCMVTACTYLTTKWPHLARPGEQLVRASIGRFGDERFDAMDDDTLARRVAAELAGLVGASGSPVDATVTRWHDALPQYRVHHLLRVGGVESALRRLGSVAVAGAAYHGVGIPACIASGRSAARQALASLHGGEQRLQAGDGAGSVAAGSGT